MAIVSQNEGVNIQVVSPVDESPVTLDLLISDKRPKFFSEITLPPLSSHGLNDQYQCFRELKNDNILGKDYLIDYQDRGDDRLFIAPHGGFSECGTSELVRALAGKKYSYATLDRLSACTNNLHITAVRFDEPNCVRLVEKSRNTIAIHGTSPKREQVPVIYLGGLDDALSMCLFVTLKSAGFVVKDSYPRFLSDRSEMNIANRGGRGVQIELSRPLRNLFFKL